MANKFHAEKAASDINKMNIKGVSAKTINVTPEFTEDQAARIKKARELLKGKNGR